MAAGKHLVITLAAAAAVLAGMYWYAGRGADEAAATPAARAPAPDQPTLAAAPMNAPAPVPAAPASLADLIADAGSGDAARRAAAIQALATAPRAEALPVLGGILLNGEPVADRPLALASLRELALTQGDADGKVREAVRAAIYHGDDFSPTEAAQETLDVIEESLLR